MAQITAIALLSQKQFAQETAQETAQEMQPSQCEGIHSPVCMSESAETLVPAGRTERPDCRNFKASANQAADIEIYTVPWLEEVWTRAAR